MEDGPQSSKNGGAVAPAPPTRRRAQSGAGGGAAAGGSSGSGAEGDATGHHQIRDIKRGDGQSAVKSAAYITGEPMFDLRVGLSFGRALKAGRVLAVGTVGPKGSNWKPAALWGAAESAETRRNARVAQERVLALPHELDEVAHKRLLNGYALHLRDRYGVAATWALHAPGPHGDQRNVHGHILTTTRSAGVGKGGEPVLGEKVRALSGDRKTVSAEVEHQRAEWARRVNAELERAGVAKRLDHRSHARRADAGEIAPGIEPARHRGAAESAKQRRDPRRRARAEAAEKGRGERNRARTDHWRALGADRVATGILRAVEQTDTHSDREAAAAARWAVKQAKDWEKWRRQQEQNGGDGDGGRGSGEGR